MFRIQKTTGKLHGVLVWFFAWVVFCCCCFCLMFTQLKGVEIAVLSMAISSAQQAFLLISAFSVTVNTAQNIPDVISAPGYI